MVAAFACVATLKAPVDEDRQGRILRANRL